MSRIFDALKNVQATRSKSGTSDAEGLGVMERPELRQSPRREFGCAAHCLRPLGERISILSKGGGSEWERNRGFDCHGRGRH